ncbi:hypothetical protein B5S30_g778 [[Candida] boidinii]|nr:hypothetical protein B5S30_g778 [[Candida] boidinii]
MDSAELINHVILNLTVPQDNIPTSVSLQYNNAKNLQNEIQAYAKISGRDWTYYVKSLNIIIGRNTDSHNNNNLNDPSRIDIDLGPSKVVSRRHASISYNLETRNWELTVLGRNGLKIDGARINSENNGVLLNSGNIIDIGGTQMMFILPDAPPTISNEFLINLRHKRSRVSDSNGQSLPGSYNDGFVPNDSLKGFQMFNRNSLADPTTNYGYLNSNGQNNKNLINDDDDQDLSKDEAKDLKPPYSYATMITQAILSNPQGVLSLADIYDWISSHYAYYRHSKQGWQNSIRHNLSLNKAFEKVARQANEPGKGMKWQIAEKYKNEFLSQWKEGSLNKTRRGSSVSRQLQLHLLKNNSLPESLSSSSLSKTTGDINTNTNNTNSNIPNSNDSGSGKKKNNFIDQQTSTHLTNSANIKYPGSASNNKPSLSSSSSSSSSTTKQKTKPSAKQSLPTKNNNQLPPIKIENQLNGGNSTQLPPLQNIPNNNININNNNASSNSNEALNFINAAANLCSTNGSNGVGVGAINGNGNKFNKQNQLQNSNTSPLRQYGSNNIINNNLPLKSPMRSKLPGIEALTPDRKQLNERGNENSSPALWSFVQLSPSVGDYNNNNNNTNNNNNNTYNMHQQQQQQQQQGQFQQQTFQQHQLQQPLNLQKQSKDNSNK